MGLCKAPAATMPQCFLKCLLLMAMAVRMGKVQGPNDSSGASEGGGGWKCPSPLVFGRLANSFVTRVSDHANHIYNSAPTEFRSFRHLCSYSAQRKILWHWIYLFSHAIVYTYVPCTSRLLLLTVEQHKSQVSQGPSFKMYNFWSLIWRLRYL